MKNRRVFILGFALILLALVTAAAFAASGEKDGVLWVVVEGKSSRLGNGNYKYYIELYNSNDYRVEVQISNSGQGGRYHYLNAGETKHLIASAAGNTYVQVVTKK